MWYMMQHWKYNICNCYLIFCSDRGNRSDYCTVLYDFLFCSVRFIGFCVGNYGRYCYCRLIEKACQRLTKLESEGCQSYDAWNQTSVDLVKAAKVWFRDKMEFLRNLYVDDFLIRCRYLVKVYWQSRQRGAAIPKGNTSYLFESQTSKCPLTHSMLVDNLIKTFKHRACRLVSFPRLYTV